MFTQVKRAFCALPAIGFLALMAPTGHAYAAGPTAESLIAQANNQSWTTVRLAESFVSPVVVCTPQYAPSGSPAVVRIRNTQGSSFELQLTRLDGKTERIDYAVRCLAVEKGVYNQAEHGVKMEAGHYLAMRTDRANSYQGRPVQLQNSYSRGVVVGQVVTTQDPRFSVFWAQPSAGTTLGVQGSSVDLGKHVLEDSAKSRRAEVLGYIVVEAGSGSLGNLQYEAGIAALAAKGPDDGPPAIYSLASLVNASSAVLSSWGMLGMNGAYPALAGSQAVQPSSLSFFVDEDQIQDPERSHVPESVAYLAVAPNTTKTPPPPPEPEITLQMSPTTVELRPSQSQTFAVTATGGDPGPLQWSLSAPIGSLAASGKTAVYVAPPTITDGTTVEVKAVSSMAPNKIFATGLISLLPTITTSITPGAVELEAGESTQFSATVANTADQRVRWSIDKPVGTITQSGLYTAPASEPVGQTVTVIAQADASPGAIGEASVALHPDADVLSFTTYENGLKTLVFQGVDYNYTYGEALLTKLYYTNSNGETFEGAPSCKKIVVDNVVKHNCQLNGAQTTLTAAYSLCRNDTLCVDLQLSNGDPDLSIETALLSPVGFSMNSFRPEASFGLDNLGPGNPLTIGDFQNGKWALWFDGRYERAHVKTQCGWQYICKSQPRVQDLGPTESISFRLSVRFTSDVDIARNELAPEAFENYRKSYPPVISWPDRRPIVSWFMGEVGKRSDLNPRGYLQQSDLDVSNHFLFRDAVLKRARQIRDSLETRPVRPQGIILWDIEGQEFIHPTTYIGDPRVFEQGYAPEMDQVADELFATFRDAGYRVGVTIRPQYLQWGTTLPPTCTTNSNHDFKDYFIKIDNTYRQRFHACYDPAGTSWSIIPDGNGGQTAFAKTGQDDEVYALLKDKAKYAHDRWGVTIFYVDSAVYSGGQPINANILRSLQADFPDSLFIPEQENLDTMTAGIPFSDLKVGADPKLAPLSWRWAYPESAIAIRVPDCQSDCWTKYRDSVKVGQKVGDVILYNAPFQMNLNHLAAIEEAILEARSEAGSILVLDSASGRQYTFRGQPAEILDFPVKMRVYFGSSESTVNGSLVYCEAGQWLGEASCDLDLSTSSVYQIRYYDFSGALVSSQPAQRLD